MQDYGQQYMPYMQTMGVSPQNYPMATMPAEQMESMYPQVYYRMYPMVQAHCSMWMAQYPMYTPTAEQLGTMAEDVSVRTEQEMDGMTQGDGGSEDRQFGFGRRRFLRDLASILLIRELIGRRRRHYYGYPGYGYPGYDYPGYGYPGYGYSGY
jgi:hypothetical protein